MPAQPLLSLSLWKTCRSGDVHETSTAPNVSDLATPTISELAEPFGRVADRMKKHIRLLEGAELVTTEKIGRARRCTLVPCAFEGISTWLQRLDRFAQVVERTKGAR